MISFLLSGGVSNGSINCQAFSRSVSLNQYRYYTFKIVEEPSGRVEVHLGCESEPPHSTLNAAYLSLQLGKGLVFAIGIAIIAVAMAYIFRFVYDQPEPEPATYWDIAHSRILEILHLIEERYIKPAFKSLQLKSAS